MSLLTFGDDLTDILIEDTPRNMSLKDWETDKRLTRELGKVGCELEASKEEILLRWVEPNVQKHLAKCSSGQVAFRQYSDIWCAGWKWEEEQAR